MTLTLAIDAIPHKETAFGRRAYTPATIRDYKQAFGLLVRSQFRDPPLTGALKVELRIYRAKKSATSRNFGDLDNLTKPILDACTGALWLDDSQIVDLHVSKASAPSPSVEISVEVI